jgi:hypothetical protein
MRKPDTIDRQRSELFMKKIKPSGSPNRQYHKIRPMLAERLNGGNFGIKLPHY